MKNVSSTRLSLCCLYVILSVLGLLETSHAFSVKSYDFPALVRVARQARCDGFKCGSGECLEVEKRCDGRVDCKDGSDEFSDCKDAVQCPGYVFTCDYGACIDLEMKCDGKKDCRDNSDEANCIDTVVEKVSSNCKSNQFECKSGQCIPAEEKCDGKKDCDDRSDETKETCLNLQCPGWTFKCDYGACVDGYAKCNNVTDCIDNSDEEDCPNMSLLPTPTPTPTARPPVGPVTEGCILPEHPDFGQWSIAGGATAYPQQKVADSTLLVFGCNKGYLLSSESKILVCYGKEWSVAIIPTCLKLCKPLYSRKFTTIKCYDSRKNVIKCEDATDGAEAEFECAPYFEPSDGKYKKRYCRAGTWDRPEPVCQPVCGEKKVSATPLVVNGKPVQKGNYPWMTAMFYKNDDGSYQNVCGGSMLTQNIILTAAHCVTDDYGNLISTDRVLVAVGKYYNKYKDPRDTEAQYSPVESIIIHERYRGDSQRFALDIALIITAETLLLSKVVQPVCYEGVSSLYLQPGNVGVVPGWGWTTATGKPSEELKELKVPYKDQQQCDSELPREWASKYFTPDKICGGYFNKSMGVCRGDSGGGYVFKHSDRYYVHGIVSLAQTVNGGCNIQISSLYTNVASHYDWLEKKVAQNTLFY